jgi:hypothetical protein
VADVVAERGLGVGPVAVVPVASVSADGSFALAGLAGFAAAPLGAPFELPFDVPPDALDVGCAAGRGAGAGSLAAADSRAERAGRGAAG